MANVGQKGQEFYEHKVEKFSKRPVSQDNYTEFIRDVETVISEANSSIEEMREDINRLERKREGIKNDIGEDTLEDFRDQSAGRWHHDILEIRKVADQIIDKRERMFERAMVRGDLNMICRKKIQPILESLDAQQIRSDVYEQMNDLTERRIENLEERLRDKIEALESKIETVDKESSRKINDVRSASRREAQDNADDLIEFMRDVIRMAEQDDFSTEDLEGRVDDVGQGGELDDVDLSPSLSEKSGEESGSDVSDSQSSSGNSLDSTGGSSSSSSSSRSGGEEGSSDSKNSKLGSSSSDGDSGSGSSSNKSSNRTQIEQELRKIENGESEKTQAYLAKEYDVSAARISQIKSGLNL